MRWTHLCMMVWGSPALVHRTELFISVRHIHFFFFFFFFFFEIEHNRGQPIHFPTEWSPSRSSKSHIQYFDCSPLARTFSYTIQQLVKPQSLEHLWNDGNEFEKCVLQATEDSSRIHAYIILTPLNPTFI